jgi:hypothetical protein
MRRRKFAAAISGVVIALACGSAFAQIFKCREGDAWVLQQAPCPGLGQTGGRMIVLPNGRPAPIAPPNGASGAASDVPRLGRVLGRTPRPSSELAAKAN